MGRRFILAIICTLILYTVFGQTNKSNDKKQKTLIAFASKLNGVWKSETSSDMIRFIISTKNFKGQLLLPYEAIQQTAPISIKLEMTALGKINLIKRYSSTKADTVDIKILANKLILEKTKYTKQKK